MATWPVDRNEWCKQQKKLKTSWLAGGVILASIYVKYSIFFMQTFEADKMPNASWAH